MSVALATDTESVAMMLDFFCYKPLWDFLIHATKVAKCDHTGWGVFKKSVLERQIGQMVRNMAYFLAKGMAREIRMPVAPLTLPGHGLYVNRVFIRRVDSGFVKKWYYPRVCARGQVL